MIENFLKLKECGSLEIYIKQKKVYQDLIKKFTSKALTKNSGVINLDEIGINVLMPFNKVGKNGSTLDLLAVEDIELFSLYKKLASSGKTLVDIGSNIGLHSLIWNKYGGISHGYEPDPFTYMKGLELFNLNNLNLKEFKNEEFKLFKDKNINYYNTAIGDNSISNFEEFVRFEDNPTGNHLIGRKANLYGNYEIIKVPIIDVSNIPKDVDCIKIDAEGADLEILRQIISLKSSHFHKLKFIYLCDWRETNAEGMIKLAQKNNLKICHGLTSFEVNDEQSMYKEHRHSFATLYLD